MVKMKIDRDSSALIIPNSRVDVHTYLRKYVSFTGISLTDFEAIISHFRCQYTYISTKTIS